MKRALTFTAMLLLSASALAYECDELPLMTSVKEDGTRMGLFATQAVLEKTPNWQPGMGEPPVSVARAVNAVQTWSKGFYSGYETVAVENVYLMQQGCWEVEGRWLYVVGLAPVVEGSRLSSGGHMAAVLMDGSIVEPREFR